MQASCVNIEPAGTASCCVYVTGVVRAVNRSAVLIDVGTPFTMRVMAWHARHEVCFDADNHFICACACRWLPRGEPTLMMIRDIKVRTWHT